ncbi:integrase arm-type DNA-binding domain-containing protein [Paraburkholderia sp. MMS20-SJTR3]|uniref:Integrase arm-type DNA-binding domain-containing protein n=1 Tax=Paraburkholderia sejongensis TaxID=2886946 RepID=A0ABS8JTY3_9BURK|nr:integrase arm-type DNA-binding domain-containing protein [Paraburkholderia sp. MMS20-SJTR3]MCC8393359.1 integrase arm-type DNA-binding domain-containing protein [Paraburkholderia sp. MMS20-SJTR3]
MPRLATPLTESQVRALEPRATRYCVADGNGLVIEVMTTGSKIWRFRYTLNGKRQPLATIGDYRMISLRVARAKAQKYAALVAQGISPVATARRDRGAESKADVLREAAELYLATALAGKSDEYRRTTRRALDKDVLPAIGNKPIAAVSADDIVAICERIKRRGSPKMALHTRNVVKRLYAYLIARQLATSNPAQIVPARSIATFDSRTRVLSGAEIGVTLHTIDTSNIRRPLKLALHLLVLTMARKSDLVDAKWAEFDLERARWTIPAARLNAREQARADRVVHLSRQALALLRELQRDRASDNYLFPSVRGDDRPIAKSTLNQAVKALGLDVEHFVLHDFRRTAATHLRESAQQAQALDTTHSEAAAEAETEATAEAARQHHLLQSWADLVDSQIEAARHAARGAA